VGSLFSSDARAVVLFVCLTIASALAPGCVTVRPEQREFLADPSMAATARAR
jgi:hypothetical protein